MTCQQCPEFTLPINFDFCPGVATTLTAQGSPPRPSDPVTSLKIGGMTASCKLTDPRAPALPYVAFLWRRWGLGPMAQRKKQLIAEGKLDKHGRPNAETPKEYLRALPDAGAAPAAAAAPKVRRPRLPPTTSTAAARPLACLGTAVRASHESRSTVQCSSPRQ